MTSPCSSVRLGDEFMGCHDGLKLLMLPSEYIGLFQPPKAQRYLELGKVARYLLTSKSDDKAYV